MKQTLVILLLWFSSVALVKAQPSKTWDDVKLMGQRIIITSRLRGSPYLFDDWRMGTVVLTNGDRLDGIPLKYNALYDELLTYNEAGFTVVKIEKASIQSFQIQHLGEDWLFEQRYFDGLVKGNHFFRVLYTGKVEFLYQYRVDIENTSVYKDGSGVPNNQEFVARERCFLYSPSTGYSPFRLKRKSLLRRIGKEDLPRARLLLRQNHLIVGNPESFASALELLETNHIQLHL
jgi:hypothetical protein